MLSKGMQQEFGEQRVFNAPIAEDFIMGTANGMSRFNDKIRIVVEGAEFADYFWPAMEQFVEMTHDYWRSNGKFSVQMLPSGLLQVDISVEVFITRKILKECFNNISRNPDCLSIVC